MISLRILLMADYSKYTFAYFLFLVYLLYKMSTQILALFLTDLSSSKYQINF